MNEIREEKELQKILDQYLTSANYVKEYILSKGQKRFSHKKMVADLGEYYFNVNCSHLFKELYQATTATAEADYRGIFKEMNLNKKFPNEVRIEVKTRYAQKNDPYLLGIKVEKFDILVFIHLNENYSCRYIGILDKNELDVIKNNRLIYKDNLQTLWETSNFVKIKSF